MGSSTAVASTFEFTCRLGSLWNRVEPEDRDAFSSPEIWGGRPLRILVAEGNPVNPIIATRTLHQRGHDVRVVSTGVEAIKTWEAESFDLILIDNQNAGNERCGGCATDSPARIGFA